MSNMNKAAMVLAASVFLLGACATTPTAQQTDEHAAHQHDVDPAATQMHGNMQKMQALMAKIHATKDPAERRQLMAEHRAAMRSQMKGMHDMMGQASCPMMGSGEKKKGGMMGGHMDGHKPGEKGGMMSKDSAHPCPMMGHMKMMHEMMGQMMEHMSAEHGDKPDSPGPQPEHVH
jgi:hypothetical protein